VAKTCATSSWTSAPPDSAAPLTGPIGRGANSDPRMNGRAVGRIAEAAVRRVGVQAVLHGQGKDEK
jgi:hypothetical protein